jgi:hypothetical protein
MMIHDIYDPPPVPPVDWDPPKTSALVFSRGDLLCLAALCTGLLGLALLAWKNDPILALVSASAGALVILESWITTLGYLHRAPPVSLKLRWTIFLAALIPWIIGLGFAVCLMLCLLWLSDHLG